MGASGFEGFQNVRLDGGSRGFGSCDSFLRFRV